MIVAAAESADAESVAAVNIENEIARDTVYAVIALIVGVAAAETN